MRLPGGLSLACFQDLTRLLSYFPSQGHLLPSVPHPTSERPASNHFFPKFKERSLLYFKHKKVKYCNVNVLLKYKHVALVNVLKP